MANKGKEEFKKLVKEKKEQLKEVVAKLSPSQLKAHYAKVEKLYKLRKTPSLLGDFSFDKENVYYWNTYDDNPRKLPERQALGWGFATREEARKAGLGNRLTDQTLDGETCVEMSHQSHRAVLLKIPKELYDINREIKERIKQNRPVLDADGNLFKSKTTEDLDRVVHRRTEQEVNLD